MSTADMTLPAKFDWSSEAATARRKRRHRADRRLRRLGIGAIVIAIGLLSILITSLAATGYRAFVQTMVTVPVYIDPQFVKEDDPAKGNYRAIVKGTLASLFPDVTSPGEQRALGQLLTNNTQFFIRDRVVADPSIIGKTIEMTVPVSDPFDQLEKGVLSRSLPENQRKINDMQIGWFDALAAEGRISTPFNWGLFFNSDSRFPELAGLAGAIVGSLYALLVCFLISFPVGIAAAVYLEEFAPKNKWTDLIEVNINNLAAVPSIVFGLLGLAVFLNFFGLPRSAPLVGGMVLSLMTLPTIIIVTRASLKAVPPSIREGALGMGASRHQVIAHHVLPLALPGILTGTIIGLAQALGETAPLLLIGMNAFITSPPGGLMDASTALPTQIFIWADSPERGFVDRTSAAILVLLGFLILMNITAIFLRQRLERTW
ncbi:phosphate ABC transporter permease PstA [Microbaculum marinisediminis]|uniref:Phosphate transport system permease protein PstA n=1 Tax=Microbaculum marinisediminis TaxID=2931392 RepID=A0AAW5QRR6_9HYPH|nr:phosphate ABC transporter permease PstA [Microbaculum sp. A6E488]MCT8970751.1 phosphate ABC transporter permease PstA [Microbaculum sp. A6E488]